MYTTRGFNSNGETIEKWLHNNTEIDSEIKEVTLKAAENDCWMGLVHLGDFGGMWSREIQKFLEDLWRLVKAADCRREHLFIYIESCLKIIPNFYFKQIFLFNNSGGLLYNDWSYILRFQTLVYC
jgi:hypothetical protein